MERGMAGAAGAQVVRAGAGEVTGPLDGARDRFLVDGADSGRRVALVEHLLPPRMLAAPMHRHTREDEFSFVLEGRVGASLGGDVVIAEVGDLVVKPRAQWHTFWNAGDTPARVLEVISPAGLEDLFRQLGEGYPAPEVLAELAAAFGAQVDFEQTMAVVAAHELEF
jgi:mannose-6-phosphate isomerase-like protein (cupin superfamily)